MFVYYLVNITIFLLYLYRFIQYNDGDDDDDDYDNNNNNNNNNFWLKNTTSEDNLQRCKSVA
jgi:hypothetical protein